jgi:hypothetical protein
VELQGLGHCHWVTGSRDERRHHSRTKHYVNSKRTFYGKVYKTPVIDDAGANAIYGPPWCPDEGVLYMGIPDGVNQIIIRVMDYNYLVKDEVIGEVLVDISNMNDNGKHEVHLTRNGKQEKGMLDFSVAWDDTASEMFDSSNRSMRTFKLKINKATGLRQAGWFDKNDVYVQAYCMPDGAIVEPDKPLPLPDENITLPAGHLMIPFQFRLPNNLPSSIVKGNDDYVAYSIYSHIDVSWEMDPSCRRYFTVLQHQDPKLLHTPIDKTLSQGLYFQCCIPPFCCCCSFSLDCCCEGYGTLDVACKLDRSSYGCGEDILVNLNISSAWDEAPRRLKNISVSLVQHYTFHATDGETSNHVLKLSTIENVTFDTKQVVLRVPTCAPSFTLNLGQEMEAWNAQVAQYGDRYGNPVRARDPITWHYEIEVNMTMELPGVTGGYKFMTQTMPIWITAVGLGGQGGGPSAMAMDRDIPNGTVANASTFGLILQTSSTQATIRHPEQDLGSMTDSNLSFTPKYYVVMDTNRI